MAHKGKLMEGKSLAWLNGYLEALENIEEILERGDPSFDWLCNFILDEIKDLEKHIKKKIKLKKPKAKKRK